MRPELQGVQPLPEGIDRGVVIFNQHGMFFDRVKPALQDVLANSHIKHWVQIQTQQNTEDTIYDIQEKTPDNSVAVSFGGDWTVNTASYALKNRLVHYLFGPGGNATDVALQLNDIMGLQTPSKLLSNSNVVDFNPLEFEIEMKGESLSTTQAVGYVTAGTTPRIHEILEMPKHRNHRMRTSDHKAVALLYEGAVSLSKLYHAEYRQPFRIRESTGLNERLLMEIMAVNGDRMAKVGRFATALTDERFIHSEIAVDPDHKLKNAYTIGKSMLQLVRGTYPAKYVEAGEELAFSLPEDEKPLIVQYDGVLSVLPPGATMRVRRANYSIRALTGRSAA